jgi:hypothetical protein
MGCVGRILKISILATTDFFSAGDDRLLERDIEK